MVRDIMTNRGWARHSVRAGVANPNAATRLVACQRTECRGLPALPYLEGNFVLTLALT